MSTARVSRALGGMEKQQYILGLDSVFNLVVSMELSGQEFSVDELQNAVNELQRQHFYLHARLGKKPYPNIKDSDVKRIPIQPGYIQQESDLAHVLHYELNTGFTDRFRPLCRIRYLKNAKQQKCHIYITMHHMICDGISALQLCGQLLTNLNIELARKYRNTRLFPVRPTLEEMLPTIEKQALATTQEEIPFPVKLASPLTLETGTVSLTLTQQETSDLRDKLHAHQLTMQPYLLACLALAFQAQAKVERFPINCSTLINMRPYLTQYVANQELGCYISAFTKPVILQSQTLLELAQLLAADMKHEFATNKHIEGLQDFDALLKSNPTKQGSFEIFAAKKPYAAVSNCGVTQLDKRYGNIILENISPHVGIHNEFNNSHAALVLCHTFDGKLMLNFQYPHPVMSVQVAETIGMEFKRLILQPNLAPKPDVEEKLTIRHAPC